MPVYHDVVTTSGGLIGSFVGGANIGASLGAERVYEVAIDFKDGVMERVLEQDAQAALRRQPISFDGKSQYFVILETIAFKQIEYRFERGGAFAASVLADLDNKSVETAKLDAKFKWVTGTSQKLVQTFETHHRVFYLAAPISSDGKLGEQAKQVRFFELEPGDQVPIDEAVVSMVSDVTCGGGMCSLEILALNNDGTASSVWHAVGAHEDLTAKVRSAPVELSGSAMGHRRKPGMPSMTVGVQYVALLSTDRGLGGSSMQVPLPGAAISTFKAAPGTRLILVGPWGSKAVPITDLLPLSEDPRQGVAELIGEAGRTYASQPFVLEFGQQMQSKVQRDLQHSPAGRLATALASYARDRQRSLVGRLDAALTSYSDAIEQREFAEFSPEREKGDSAIQTLYNNSARDVVALQGELHAILKAAGADAGAVKGERVALEAAAKECAHARRGSPAELDRKRQDAAKALRDAKRAYSNLVRRGEREWPPAR